MVLSWAGHGALQDLSSFFDSIDIRAALMLFDKLGALNELPVLIQGFYNGQTRLFKLERYFSPQWISGCRGCVQGCPFSPTIALAFRHLWSVFCSTLSTDNLIYIDDRVVWPAPGSDTPHSALSEALGKSAEYDKLLGFQRRPSECAVAQLEQDHTVDEFEYCYPITSVGNLGRRPAFRWRAKLSFETQYARTVAKVKILSFVRLLC